MKLVFLVQRLNFYKHYVAHIDEALKRGYRVECWHDYSANKEGPKGFGFPRIENIPSMIAHSVDTRKYYGINELEKYFEEQSDIDVVFSVVPFNDVGFSKSLDCFRFTWVFLMTGPDSYLYITEMKNVEKRASKEVLPLFSQEQKAYGRRFLQMYSPDRVSLIDEDYFDCRVVGNSEFDLLKYCKQDQVKRKYGIPEEKDVVVYLPFPYLNRNSSSAWERAFCGLYVNTARGKNGSLLHDEKESVFPLVKSRLHMFREIMKDPFALKTLCTGCNEKRIIEKIREFCNVNNLFLLVKPRLKFPVAERVKELADLVLWDEERDFCPTVLMDVLSISRLMVSYSSYAALTAAFSGVFHVNIELPDPLFYSDKQKYWFQYTEGSLFNFEGVSKSVNSNRAIHLFSSTLDEFTMDSARREEYVRRYIGFDDFDSSKRFFDELEKIVSKK